VQEVQGEDEEEGGEDEEEVAYVAKGEDCEGLRSSRGVFHN
jgi:hypothetical protein